MMDGCAFFLDAVKTHAKLFYGEAEKAVNADREVAGWLLDPLATWAVDAYGDEIAKPAAQGYATYALHVAKSQQAYEANGSFNDLELDEIVNSVYDEPGYMVPYMWAAILIYGLWPTMQPHLRLFRDDFLAHLPEGATVSEIACGHGVLSLLALQSRPDITVIAQDISPSALKIAERLSASAGLTERIELSVGDATAPTDDPPVDAVIAGMLAEHLPEPQKMFHGVADRLKPTGTAFIGAALESAQRDHIYEFHRESELVVMAETAGLRVEKLLSERAKHRNRGKFSPRALAMTVEKFPLNA
ncbi:MAG: class I SAM-dependent methyltransferase [Alphaproteobacteria bacterium]|nr:class I SAM-dependent methyltransferase [Alphaproteobacteria bacterium SS10]